MKKTQKIFFRVVGITVILSILCAPLTNAVSTPVAGRSYRERTLLLNRIGISAEYDEKAFITRGDFTVLALQAMGSKLWYSILILPSIPDLPPCFQGLLAFSLLFFSKI